MAGKDRPSRMSDVEIEREIDTLKMLKLPYDYDRRRIRDLEYERDRRSGRYINSDGNGFSVEVDGY